MGLLEDMDRLLQSLGFRRTADLRPQDLKRDVTEKCAEASGTGSCSSSIEGDFVLWESQLPLMGAIAFYIHIKWCADFLPREGTPSCRILIEVIGEGDSYSIVIKRVEYNECVYYA